jgi:hypothetical protein
MVERCLRCKGDMIWLHGKCQESCPEEYPIIYDDDSHKSCVQECPPTSFKANKTHCEDCPPYCLTCANEKSCNQCDEVLYPGIIHFNGLCVMACPAGFYHAKQQCYSCDSCLDCDRDGCNRCKEGYEMIRGVCIEEESMMGTGQFESQQYLIIAGIGLLVVGIVFLACKYCKKRKANYFESIDSLDERTDGAPNGSRDFRYIKLIFLI